MANPETTSGGGLLIGTRAEVLPQVALPEFNATGGPAFAARSRGDSASNLIGILCNSGLPTRIDIITAMRSIDHPSVLRMVDAGVVMWPDNTSYMSYAYQRPLAPRLSAAFDQPFPQMSEDSINHYFVTPMIGALSEFMRTGISHNGINPFNIFWRIGSATPPQVGECMSAPPGMGQPVLFETIERSYCPPLGRGPGTHFDDCYAFGVVLALLVLGQNPLRGMDDQSIIKLKNERGSFGALIGTSRIQASHIELLRGLLTDDAKQRWSAADLEQWQNGRRSTPKNTDAGKRASRGLDFNGKDHHHPRSLAAALSTNVADAVKIIENGTIDKWLRRSLNDEERAENLDYALTSLKESGKTANYEDQLVARASIALDPPAPIRYRGLAVMPAGISTLVVDSILTGNNMQQIAEIISSQLVTLWIEMQREGKAELVTMGQQFERMKTLMEKTTFGNGMERIAYELNPGLPCLSAFLRAQYVTQPKNLLEGLERVANSGNRPHEPVDRHLAAFLIVRDRRSEVLFQSMTLPDSSPKKGLALLTLFAEMQNRYGPDTVPGVAKWITGFLEPTINRFLGKTLKENLRTQVREVAALGDLNRLLHLLDDPRRVEGDQQEFMAARMLYLNILKEIAGIEHKLNNRQIIVQSMGKPMAASLCSFLAIILVILAMLRAVWQGIQ